MLGRQLNSFKYKINPYYTASKISYLNSNSQKNMPPIVNASGVRFLLVYLYKLDNSDQYNNVSTPISLSEQINPI